MSDEKFILPEADLLEDVLVPFPWKEGSSRTELIVCTVFRGNKIVRVYISPADTYKTNLVTHVVKNKYGWTGLDFGQYFCSENQNKEQIEQPIVWTTFFCKKHKTHAFRMYVPRYINFFSVKTSLEKLEFIWK